jgi:hypothetical protein
MTERPTQHSNERVRTPWQLCRGSRSRMDYEIHGEGFRWCASRWFVAIGTWFQRCRLVLPGRASSPSSNSPRAHCRY